MIVAPGATSQIVTVQVVDDSGLPVTGLASGTFPSIYYTLGSNVASVQITPLSDLAAITTAFTAKGIKERENGYYRVDVPDAAWASAGTVRIQGEATGKHVICEPVVVANLPADLQTIKTQTVTCGAGVTVLASVGTASTSTAQTGDSFARIGANGAGLTAITGVTLAANQHVIVDTNNDKTGYALSSSGIDLILVESGISASAALVNDASSQLTSINARQALALIQSACVAVLAGASTTTVTIDGAAKTSVTRVTATVDSSGNRSAVNLQVPT